MHHSVRGLNIAVLTNDFGKVSGTGLACIDRALHVEFVVVDSDLESVEFDAQCGGILAVCHRNILVARKIIEQDRCAGNGMRCQNIVHHSHCILSTGQRRHNIGVKRRESIICGYENRKESVIELASDRADELIEIVTSFQWIFCEKDWKVGAEETFKIIEGWSCDITL